MAAGAAQPASAQVTRCTDTAGKVSYTDKECPSNTRQAKSLEGIETNGTSIPGPRATLPAPAAALSRAVPSGNAEVPRPTSIPSDGGLVVIDPRAFAPRTGQPGRANADDYGDPDAGTNPYSYPYAGYPGAYRRGRNPPRDLSPTLRNCDAGGCNDTLGNHYDRTGRVDRYVRPDGRTCRPIGTTVVC